MKSDEIAKALRAECNDCSERDGNGGCRGLIYCPNRDAADLIEAQQAELEIYRGFPNEPLTLEELREMAVEPVFAIAIGSDSGIAEEGEWLIISSGLLYGVDMQDDLHDYGKTWLAYRRPPERSNNEQQV